MTVFEKAKWIWIRAQGNPAMPSLGVDEYGEFFSEFDYTSDLEKVFCRISCDGDYTLFINGEFVASNQYGDYEHYKIYDEIDITAYLKKGRNTFAALVWHQGVPTSRYKPASAGLIFEIMQGNACLLNSTEKVLCRKSKAYRGNYQKWISKQLGLSFYYDASKEDDWMTTGTDCVEAFLVSKNCSFFSRPNEKQQNLAKAHSKTLKAENQNYYLIDLGKETVGLPILEFYSETEQEIRVEFGEHLLENGHVHRLIHDRDFSYEYKCKKGENSYTNYMLRLGCRYLEIYAQQPIQLHYAGIIPQVYPTKRRVFKLDNELDQRIYDLCVTTLELCMMEHYVDCPWREQSLYAFDSRNQMLCGYYAFENGNARYAKSNLKLMSEDCRSDGLLSICYPCGVDLTIPSFSLHYFKAVEEYVNHTGDTAFVQEIYGKLISILQAFLNKRKDGLVQRFTAAQHWGFYDWSPYMEGDLYNASEDGTDLMLNVLFVVALNHLQGICERIGKSFDYADILQETKKCIRETFYRPKDGLFAMTETGEEYTELGNALAILAGLTTAEESAYICEKLSKDELIECSLSMKPFKYDALLYTDEARYTERVLNEIRVNYKKMLDAGATATWETIDAQAAFDDAGSLCHGWTAIPVYYYHKLSKK